MPYRINFEQYANNFALPREIVNDELVKLDAVYLKTILLIFSNSDKHYSVNLLSSLLNEPQSKIEEAVAYWIKRGVLREEKSAAVKPVTVLSGKSAAAVSVRKEAPAEMRYLLECMEALLGRTISPAEYKTVQDILEYLKLPADVVLMAVDHCNQSGKMNARSLEKTCAIWSDRGIITHELAEQYLTYVKQQRSNETAVKRLLGIEMRALTEKEQNLLRPWFEEYQFSFDMIKLAYERTIQYTNKPSIPYMNRILTSWHEKGYRTVEEAESEKKVSAEDTNGATYDINEIERFWDQFPMKKGKE